MIPPRPVSPSVRVAERMRALTPCAWIGVALVVAVGLTLRFLVSGPIGPLGPDVWWHETAAVTRGSATWAVAVFCAEVGGGVGAAATAAIAAALLLALKRARDAAAVATAMLLGVAVSEILKSVVLRPRPWDQLYTSHDSSYPSGHSLGAAALATSLALVVVASDGVTRTGTRIAWAAAAAWILLMMWSRTALHVHWLTDTLAGALLGVCVAILSRRFWFRALPHPAPSTR